MLDETVAGFSGSLKVALTFADAETPVAFAGGIVDVTVGGVVSDPTLVVKTTSTQ